MDDESAVKPAGKLERDRTRATQPWRVDHNIVETADGALHVATVSGGRLAEHIAELHNRTVSGSAEDEIADRDRAVRNAEQDFAEGVPGAGRCIDFLRLGLPRGPITRDSCRQAFLAGYDAARLDGARHHQVANPPPGSPRTAALPDVLNDPRAQRWLGMDRQRPDHSGFHMPPGARVEEDRVVRNVAAMLEREVHRRITLYLATEHQPSYSIKESPAMMAKALRDLGYTVTEPADETGEARG